MATRDKLAPYEGKRVTVRGWVDRSGNWSDYNSYRNVPTRCIQRPEIDGVIVADHVWIRYAQKLTGDIRLGDYISFEAEVTSYKKRLKTPGPDGLLVVNDFGLTHPANVQVIEAANWSADSEPVTQLGGLIPADVLKETRTATIEKAFGVLGLDAPDDKVVAWVKDEGLDDTHTVRNLIHQTRHNLKARAAGQPVGPTPPMNPPAPVSSQVEIEEVEGEEVEGEFEEGEGRVSWKVIREALGACGGLDADVGRVLAYLGLDDTPRNRAKVHQVRWHDKKKASQTPAPAPVEPPALVVAPVPVTVPAPAPVLNDRAALLAEVERLVDRFGADKVTRAVEALKLLG